MDIYIQKISTQTITTKTRLLLSLNASIDTYAIK